MSPAEARPFWTTARSQRLAAPTQPAPQQPETSRTLGRLVSLRAEREVPASRQPNGAHHNNTVHAPASWLAQVSNPNELKDNALVESQHYAATSFIGSESLRSGRESGLSKLFDRVGSMRRSIRKMAKSAIKAPLRMTSSGSGSARGSQVTKMQASDIYAEGYSTLAHNSQPREQVESELAEGALRVKLAEHSKSQPDYQELIAALVNWINDELANRRILVRDLLDDLYDGQILVELTEKLTNCKLDIVWVTQNQSRQKQKLQNVLERINRLLTMQNRHLSIQWTLDGIYNKNAIEIMHLLIALAIHFRAPVKLPQNVRVDVVVEQMLHGQLIQRSHTVQLTDANLNKAMEFLAHPNKAKLTSDGSMDYFDRLLTNLAPDKMAIVKQKFVNFCNRHLNKIGIDCTSRNPKAPILDPEQFSDGRWLVFLISVLEDFFVPLGHLMTEESTTTFHSGLNLSGSQASSATTTNMMPLANRLNQTKTRQTPQSSIQVSSYINSQPIHKLHNLNIAFELMKEAGVPIADRIRPDDIANADLNSLLHILYTLFKQYKHI